MKENDLISIIIPTYNSANYIARCLDSVKAQTYSNLEIILIDNNSTDETVKICQQYANANILFCPLQGASNARNMGIESATGKYIIFVDSDDYMEINYVEKLYNFLMQSRSQLAICGYYLENEDLVELSRTYGKSKLFGSYEALEYLLRPDGFEGYLWNKIFDREVLNGIKFRKDLKMWEDLVFVTEYVMRCKSIYYNPTPLYHYVKRPNSVVNMRFQKKYVFDYNYLTELDAADIILSIIPSDAVKAQVVIKNRKVESSIGIIESALRCYITDYELINHMQSIIRKGLKSFIFEENHAVFSKKVLAITLCHTYKFAKIYWVIKHDILKK